MSDPPDPDGSTAASDGARRRAALLEEAALWRARLDSGSAEPAEFERWRAASPENAIAYARIASTWTAFDDMAVAPVRPVRRPDRRAALLGLLGVGVVASGLGLGVGGRSLARERAITGIGQRRTVTPAPGLEVQLNTDSRLAWRRRGGQAQLWLEKGEAAVTARSPGVVVSAAGATVTLAAGRYNIRMHAGQLECSVLNGGARSAAGVEIGPGQRLVGGGPDMSAETLPSAAAGAISAWPGGELVFEDTTVREAAAEYNRYLTRKLVVADPAVGALRIGGRFTSTDPTDFLRALGMAFDVRHQAEADRIIVG